MKKWYIKKCVFVYAPLKIKFEQYQKIMNPYNWGKQGESNSHIIQTNSNSAFSIFKQQSNELLHQQLPTGQAIISEQTRNFNDIQNASHSNALTLSTIQQRTDYNLQLSNLKDIACTVYGIIKKNQHISLNQINKFLLGLNQDRNVPVEIMNNNLKRRVYDVINVMLAARAITKTNKKTIKLLKKFSIIKNPTIIHQPPQFPYFHTLQLEISQKQKRIQKKKAIYQRMATKALLYRQLQNRNRKKNKTPQFHLPLLFIRSDKTIIQAQQNDDSFPSSSRLIIELSKDSKAQILDDLQCLKTLFLVDVNEIKSLQSHSQDQ